MGGFVQSTSKTIRVGVSWTVPGAIAVAAGAVNYIPPQFVPVPSFQTARIVGVRCAIRNGLAANFDVQQNGAVVAGLSGVTAGGVPTFFAATGAPAVADGDRLAPVITSVSGAPDGLFVTIYIDLTV